MAESSWYYADGDMDKGPINESQLRELFRSGKLNSNTLIWRDGMKDWVPARQVKGMAVPTESPGSAKSKPTRRQTEPAAGLVERFHLANPLYYGKRIGQPLMLLGLLLVLLAKGCDSIGQRYVDRMNGKNQLAVSRFNDRYDRRQIALEDEQQVVRDKEERDERDDARMSELTEQLAGLAKEKEKEQRQLQRGRWRKLEVSARDAGAVSKTWGYWRECLFMLGTILLTVGLLAVGFTGEGPERWICLLMLAIVTFSIYIWPG